MTIFFIRIPPQFKLTAFRRWLFFPTPGKGTPEFAPRRERLTERIDLSGLVLRPSGC
jgi:hypothetical protein